jgi:shikimate kinase
VVVLIGFMGAGKTTIGRLLALELGWRFLDFDEEIVRRTGTSVAHIFREQGEAAFRELEARLTGELSSVERTVIAPGGGWITQPGLLERLPTRTRTVWLRVSPEEAVLRLRAAGAERPLFSGPDPLPAARDLLARREALYLQADHVVDVDGRTPAEIVAEITTLLRK